MRGFVLVPPQVKQTVPLNGKVRWRILFYESRMIAYSIYIFKFKRGNLKLILSFELILLKFVD